MNELLEIGEFFLAIGVMTGGIYLLDKFIEFITKDL